MESLKKITYCENGTYELEQLVDLYKNVGWLAYSNNPEKLHKAFKNSLFNIGVFHEEELIGVIRVIGDDASIIYIQDILVKEKYQGFGVGTYLLKQVLKKYKDIRQVVLMTDDTLKTKNFYEKNGMFNCGKYDGVAFVRYNFEQ